MNGIGFKFYKIACAAWRRRYMIIIPVIIFPVLSLFVAKLAPKTYKAHTSILIQETAKLNPFLEDLAVSSMLDERINALKTLLHSRHILRSVASELGLINEEMTELQIESKVKRLSGKLQLRVISKDLYKLELVDTNPKNMKNTLEVVSRHFINELLSPERAAIASSEKFLMQQLVEIKDQLDASETDLAEFKNKYPSELPEMRSANLNRLNTIKLDLYEKLSELAGEERRLGGIEDQIRNTDPVLSEIERKIIQVKGEISHYLSRYTEQHSKIKALKRSLARLEEERQEILEKPQESNKLTRILDLAANSQSGTEGLGESLLITQIKSMQDNLGRINSLKEQSEYLKGHLQQLEQQASLMGSKERELAAIERNIRVKQALYEDLLNRYEMAKVTGSLSLFESKERVKLIDKPFDPQLPSNPALVIFIVAGVFGGIFMGCGLALVFELIDTSVRWRDQIENELGIKVVGRIPKLDI